MQEKGRLKNNQKVKGNNPRVSIGMPVFDGEKYLRESLESILNQTYQNFELIISDNASTDHTQQICLEYAAKDNRIHYYRNTKNLGAPKNYNRVFELSSGEYFKWAAYDDVLAPEFLEKCVYMLDKDPSVVGCICKTGRIDKDGNFLGYYNEKFLKKIDSPKSSERFRDLLEMYYTTTPFHGVYRKSLFAKSQLHGSYIGADRNLVAELSLMGRIYTIPECLFFWRDHPDSYTSIFYGSIRKNTLDCFQKEMAWWSIGGMTYFPHWKNCIEYFRSVNRIPQKLPERISCYIQVFDWFLRQGRRFMAKDIILFMLIHSNLANRMKQKMGALNWTGRLRSAIAFFTVLD
jgi:glycosyltransferase involved in cell wall biosynthesis